MKIPSSLYKILPVILLFFISALPVQALSFPSTQPTGEISGGKFNQILTNVFLDCGAGKYIQGFTSTGVADCKSVANFNTLTLAAGQSNATSGSGLFQKYFTKILNDCGTGRYVRGFDASKNLICEDKTQAVTLMGESVSLVSPVVTVPFPPTPAGQSPGGTFTDSFNTIFAADCGAGKYLQGFDASKNKICGSIVTTNAISDCTQLQNIGTNATTLSGSYHLTNNIDCSATSLSGNPLNHGGLGFKPIGNSTTPFKGTLDGAGYKIMGLSIHRPTETAVGLLGVASIAIIKNLGIDGANIQGGWGVGGFVGSIGSSALSNSYTTNSTLSGSHIGGLVGISSSNTISGSYTAHNTLKGSTVGGLAGYSSSTPLSNSYTTYSTISGYYHVGGLVGDNGSSSMSGSYATNNTISGDSFIGGLIGNNNATAPITNSYAANNTISGILSYIGGLVGNNNVGSITNSYATNNIISGTDTIGGLVGNSNSSSIANSYTTNNTINGTSNMGGLVGSNVGSTINSYAADNTINGTSNMGGLFGYDLITFAPITSSYYNKDTFTMVTPYGSGKTTLEMITQGTYTGWDFSAAWKPMSALTGYYPCLAWQTTSTCTKAPGVITNCTELQNIGTSTGALAGKYQLASDIDCSMTTSWNSGLGFKPIGDTTTPFSGVLDGKGYKITGLYIKRPLEGYVGLIGKANAASIKNLKIDGAIITGQWYVGGLVGYIDGSSLTNIYIDNSKIEGAGNTQSIGGIAAITYTTNIVGSNIKNSTIKTMSSSAIAGGLIGFNNNSPVSTSYTNTVEVKGGGQVGGLIGYNNYGLSTISDSYSTKNIVTGGGGYDVGGLIGFNNNTALLSNSFASFNSVTGGNSVGGLIGMNINVVSTKDSYANNNTVNGTSSVGGFIGSNYYYEINNSYANNNTVNGTSSVGGFIGYIVGTAVNNSYSANNIVTGATKIGGFIGENPNAPISSSYFDKDTFTGATLYGSGKTTAEMVTQGTYAGWDFSAVWKPMSGTLAGYYPCLAWQSAGSCVKPNTYPGCDTPDIVVGAYTIAACNVGTTVAGTGITSYGNYFQWGNNGGTPSGTITPTTTLVNASANGPGNYYNNTAFIGAGLVSPWDWTSPQNNNLWGDTTNTSSARQGPCVSGYHVPSQPEWAGIITTGGWGSNGTTMSTALKLPFAGLRWWSDGAMYGQSTVGAYWSSSKFSPSPVSYGLRFDTITIDPSGNERHDYGYPVRCLKN